MDSIWVIAVLNDNIRARVSSALDWKPVSRWISPFTGGACTFQIVMFNEHFLLPWFLTPYGLVFKSMCYCCIWNGRDVHQTTLTLKTDTVDGLIAAPDRETEQHGVPERSPIVNNDSWLLESTWLQFVSLSVVQARNSLHVSSDVNEKSVTSIDRPLYGLRGKTNSDL